VTQNLSLKEAVRLSVLSLTATIKSTVSVGPPLDLGIYRTDSFLPLTTGRLGASDPYYQKVSSTWDEALQQSFVSPPDFEWPLVEHAHITDPGR
jgi:putative proteasome-type protease